MVLPLRSPSGSNDTGIPAYFLTETSKVYSSVLSFKRLDIG